MCLTLFLPFINVLFALCDLQRRQYDQFGSTAGSNYSSANANQGFSGFQGFQSNIDPEELFRNIFGDFAKGFGDSSYGSNDSYDFEYTSPQELQLGLSFTEAAKGCTKEVKISVLDSCPKCKGSRFAINPFISVNHKNSL